MSSPREFQNREFVVRLANHEDEYFPGGSSFIIAENSDLTALHNGGMGKQIGSDSWVSITMLDGDEPVIENHARRR